jgi:hypothetical protein
MRPAAGLTLPALLGGLFIGVLSALPIVSVGNACCCLWIVTGGVLAAFLLQDRTASPILVSDGAVVGLLAGIVGAVIYLVVALPIHLVLGPLQRRIVEGLLWRATDVPPEVRGVLESVSTGIGGLVAGFLLMLVAGVFLAPAGGALGAILFRRGRGPAAPLSGGPAIAPSAPPSAPSVSPPGEPES